MCHAYSREDSSLHENLLRTKPRTLSLKGFELAWKGWQGGPVSTATGGLSESRRHGCLLQAVVSDNLLPRSLDKR